MTEDIAALIAAMKNGPEEEQWTMEREECVAQLVQHCKQLLLTDEEECMCGWALVDPFYRCTHCPRPDCNIYRVLSIKMFTVF